MVWLVWSLAGGAIGDMLGEIGLALGGGIALVVPLALLLAQEPDRRGDHPLVFRLAVWGWMVAAPLAMLSLLGEPSALSAALALPWLVATLLVGAFGLRRFARRSHFDLAETCMDAGLAYLPVGGVWLLTSRAGLPLLGFAEPWTSLTAAHFHFAGLGVPILAGMAGRALPLIRDARGEEPFGLRLAWSIPAWASIVGPPLTALGIASARVLEFAGAVVMLTGAVGTGGFLLVVGLAGRVPRISRAALLAAGAVPVLTSALAMIWAGGRLMGGDPFPTMPAMVRYHGLLNAVLFVSMGLAGFALSGVTSTLAAPGVPFSRLRGGRFVGRWFFRSAGLVDDAVPAPLGLVSNMDIYRRAGVPGLHDLDPAALAPAVRRFYEHTAEYAVDVSPTWRFPFSLGAPALMAAMRSVGQLELPVRSGSGMDSELLALRSGLDGRDEVRGWVRVHRGADRPVFVAAYAVHRDRDVAYMNIAMPLPGANLSSILRPDPGTHGGLVLTTNRLRGFAGDEGIYLVTRFGEVRLPMQETLVIGPAAERSEGDLAARHEVRILGVRILTMTYLLTPGAEA